METKSNKFHQSKTEEIKIMPITLVQKNKSKKIMTWYARVPDPIKKGCVHFFSLGTESKSEAKVLLQERIKSGAYDIKPESETMTLGEAAVKFEQYERNKGTKPGSITVMMRAVNTLKNLFDMRASELTTKMISEEFMKNTAKICPSTYTHRKTILSTFFSYVVDVLELMPNSPVKKAIPKRKAKKKRKDFWTSEQIDRILAHAPDPKTRLLWSFMAFAGLRRSEAQNMRPNKIYDGFIHIVGKGDKEARIPVCPRLQREIERYNGEWDFVYSQRLLEAAAKEALPEGFPGTAHAHRFRHSFGSNILRAGENVNLMVVKDLMRHENIQTTIDIYGHLLETDLKEAVGKVYK